MIEGLDQLDAPEDVTHRYLHGPGSDEVLAEETVGTTNTVQWLLSDNQGSVRDVIDGSGVSIDHIVYDSFGNIAGRSNANYALRFGYTGRESASESGDGMWYYRRRLYDATVGRFISQYPTGFNAGDVNLYRYVSNSPLKVKAGQVRYSRRHRADSPPIIPERSKP